MKYRNIVSLGIAAVVATFSLSAQPIMKAQVPFSFHIGKDLMPAGDYIVDELRSSDVLLIRSVDRRSSVMVITNAVQTKGIPSKGKLVFNRYGKAYFLSQVWRPGYEQGRQLVPTRAERETAIAARVTGESVSVALRTR